MANAITHTQHRGWEAKWRRHRTCRRHLLCTRTFPPCIWYWSLAHLFQLNKVQSFLTYFDCSGGLAFVLQTHCWDQAAKENCLISLSHNRVIASYLDWKTFSFPRPHFLEVKNNVSTRYHRKQVSEENPNWASWEPRIWPWWSTKAAEEPRKHQSHPKQEQQAANLVGSERRVL